jgi:hypothetical protein
MAFLRVALASILAAAIGCGTSSRKSGYDDNSSGGPSASSSGASSSSGDPGPLGGTSTSSSSGSVACAAEVTTAQRALVDIIVLIDTSGSMTEETGQVQQNINDFAKSIGQSGLDYRVVMIARKPSLPFILAICVPPPLAGASCADNPPSFHHLDQYVDSNDALDLVLSTYDKWSAYLRADAYKVFIVITDDNSDLDFKSFDTQLLAKQPAGMFGDANKRKYIFDSICGWQDGTPVLSPNKCSSAVNTGDVYQNLSQLTGGIVDSVCKTSFAGVFSNLAKGLVTKLGCEFAVPKADGGAIDPTKVAVQYTPGGGAPQQLTRVTDPSKCGANPDSWYFDDNTNPTKIVFCPQLCSSAGTDTNGKLEVLAGCLAPPPK